MTIGDVFSKVRQTLCRHQFRGVDLSLRGADGMVRWPCHKCGKTFAAPYGILIQSHGPIGGPWTSLNEPTK